MAPRSLSEELGHDLVLTGKSSNNSALVVSVTEDSIRKSVLVIGDQVVPIEFQQYLEEIEVAHKIEKSSWLLGKSRISRTFSTFLLVMMSAVILAGLTGLLQFRVVLTGSMMPAISPGDLIIAAPSSSVKPEIGDVIIYRAKRFDGTEVSTFAHRIVSGNEVDGFQTKGDANTKVDPSLSKMDSIDGVVVYTIPKIGLLLTLQNLFLMCIAGLGFWLLFQSKNQEWND